MEGFCVISQAQKWIIRVLKKLRKYFRKSLRLDHVSRIRSSLIWLNGVLWKMWSTRSKLSNTYYFILTKNPSKCLLSWDIPIRLGGECQPEGPGLAPTQDSVERPNVLQSEKNNGGLDYKWRRDLEGVVWPLAVGGAKISNTRLTKFVCMYY